MDKGEKNKKNRTQKKLAGQADLTEAEHTERPDSQNRGHNVKKVSLGPNTKR